MLPPLRLFRQYGSSGRTFTPASESMPAPHPRLSLFRCDSCGRVFAATPSEVRVLIRGPWPQCCGAGLLLYIETERPDADAKEVTAMPLPLPGADPMTDTTVLPTPPARKPTE